MNQGILAVLSAILGGQGLGGNNQFYHPQQGIPQSPSGPVTGHGIGSLSGAPVMGGGGEQNILQILQSIMGQGQPRMGALPGQHQQLPGMGQQPGMGQPGMGLPGMGPKTGMPVPGPFAGGGGQGYGGGNNRRMIM